MIPVVKHDQYRIGLDPETSIVYLSFETIYQGMVEAQLFNYRSNSRFAPVKNHPVFAIQSLKIRLTSLCNR